MGNRPGFIAGTALALIFAGASHAALAAPAGLGKPAIPDRYHGTAPLITLVQAQPETVDEEELRRRQQQEEEAPAEEAPAEEAPADEAPAEAPPAPQEAPPAAEEEAPAADEQPAQAEEPAPQPADEAPAEEPAPAPAEEPAPAVEEPAAEEPAVEEPAPAPAEEQAPAADEAPAEAAPDAPAAEEAPEVEEAPAAEEQAPAAEEPSSPAAEEPSAPAAEEPAAPAAEQPAAEPPEASDQQAPAAPQEQAPAGGETAPQPPAATPQAPAAAPQSPSQQGGAAGDGASAPAGEAAPTAPPTVPGQTGGAPVLDSQKDGSAAPAAAGEDGAAAGQQPAEAVPAGPPPASDAEAQAEAQPQEVVPIAREEGRRIERPEPRREPRDGGDVLREIGDRIVIQLNNQIVVQSDERERLGRDAEEVYYEELPRGRLRETIVRPNGVQVITIRDRYGDVVRRSRIMPDGREYVLVYAGERERDGDRGAWRDPGRDLPPLRLTIPYEDYVLDAGRVDDPDTYYDFFEQPPVEPVRRLYSVDEVRYSARLRDSVRRVELDTITFSFGSATIEESAVGRLDGVAEAMHRLLERNPAETFLIEGHTDAVGSDQANLALSDRRAEAVAEALTAVFDIPAENLVTQGYGEQYLKVQTQEPEQENRRVVMRRITPLVAPVASNR